MYRILKEEDGSTTKSMGDMELKGVYEKVLTFLHPGETVERALHKLGREKGKWTVYVVRSQIRTNFIMAITLALACKVIFTLSTASLSNYSTKKSMQF